MTRSSTNLVPEPEYEVESVWEIKRMHKPWCYWKILIKWVGYEQPTWEPILHLKKEFLWLLEDLENEEEAIEYRMSKVDYPRCWCCGVNPCPPLIEQ